MDICCCVACPLIVVGAADTEGANEYTFGPLSVLSSVKDVCRTVAECFETFAECFPCFDWECLQLVVVFWILQVFGSAVGCADPFYGLGLKRKTG